MEFYSQDESTRTLHHLVQDYAYQIESQVDRKKKKTVANHRAVRKTCEKLLKSLNLKISHFAHDIEEDKESVRRFFSKADMDEAVRGRILEKTRKWVIEAWLSLSTENYFKATSKYLASHIKDRKKLSPDYDLLNELYLIVIGDDKPEQPALEHPTNNNRILVDINLNFDEKYISQSFLWNPDNSSSIAIQTFIEHFLRDTITEQNIAIDHETLRDLEEDAKVQLKTQVCYKSLLKKFAPILLNFSTMELSQDIKEYPIQIELKLVDEQGKKVFEDTFEWDILNEQNNVEKFCERLIEDVELPKKYFTQLCYAIRTQINAELEWKYTMLVKTYKSILRDRESPKFHTQTTTTQIKKNLVYTMDVSLPFNPDQHRQIENLYFNNSDLFSLLSRNIDILPEEFQEVLMCRESAKNHEKETNRLSKVQADEYLRKNSIPVESNGYLGSMGNSYSHHTLWRKSLQE